MRDHKVVVWHTPCTVSVYQKSRSVWVAVGDYMGERVEVQARSESSAIAHWREAARYKGG